MSLPWYSYYSRGATLERHSEGHEFHLVKIRGQDVQFGTSVVGCQRCVGLGKEGTTLVGIRGILKRGFAPGGSSTRDFEEQVKAAGLIQCLGKECVCAGPIATAGQEASAQTFAVYRQQGAVMRARRHKRHLELRPCLGSMPQPHQRFSQPEPDFCSQMLVPLSFDEGKGFF